MSVRSAYCEVCEAQRAFEKPETSGAVGCLILILLGIFAAVAASAAGPIVGGMIAAGGVALLVLMAVFSAFRVHRCRTCGASKFFWW